MDSKIAEQILDELAPTFEAIESQSEALLRFVREKGIASDEELAPYLEQAAAASSVRWRALRVRMGRLFSLAEKSEEEKFAKKDDEQADSGKANSQGNGKESAKAPEPWSQPVSAKDSESEKSERQKPRPEEKRSPEKQSGEKPSGESKDEQSTESTNQGRRTQQSEARQPSDFRGKDAHEPAAREDKPPTSEKGKSAA